MVCLCSDAIKFSLFVHGLSGPPNEPDHQLPCLSAQRRMRARAGPVAFSLRDVLEADLPTICPNGEAKVLRAYRLRQYSQFLNWSAAAGQPHGCRMPLPRLPCHLVALQSRFPPISDVPPPLVLVAPPIPALMLSIRLSPPSSVNLGTPPKLPNPLPLCRSCCRSVKTPEHVCVYNPSNRPEERIPGKGIVVLPLEAVNVTQPRCHRDTDRTYLS